MTRGQRALALLAVSVALLSAIDREDLRAAAHTVTFRTTDGRTVTASLNEASQRPAPAVVLVPMLGRSRDDWQGMAQQLADANITALMIDLPGQALPENAKLTAGWSEDIRAALSFLEGRPDVRAGTLGVAGASLGASLAVLAAAADPRVRSLALLSPASDYRGVRIDAALRQYGARPALLMASRQDSYAARSARDLASEAPGIRELRWSDIPAHGTALLGRDPELVRALVQWFQQTLG